MIDTRKPPLLREGLCGDKGDHEPHKHLSGSLGMYWCHADQSRRMPWAGERARR